MRKIIIAVLATGLLCVASCALRPAEDHLEIPVTPSPTVTPVLNPTPTPSPFITPEPTPEPVPLWTEEEITVLAQMLWGEARGVVSVTEQAACVWCVLNRVDAYGESIVEVTTAPYQFAGYRPNNPVDPDLKALCEDVLTRYFAEKDGDPNAGRILPSDYLFFSGDGERNHFRNEYEGGQIWDWSLPSPYES